MKKLLLLACFSLPAALFSQPVIDTSWKKIYRGTASKVNDLVHTKLDARFDYSKSYLIGKAWITLTPHFYPTDSLQLDAKGMSINKVAILKDGKNIPLKYTYDNMFLSISLDRAYKKDERYTVYIDYTAKPDEYSAHGSEAITDARGLYFINPKGEEKNKPIQIWTQGETEATSVWIPTIDKPNQKTTEQFSLTVPAKYVTLSNGKLTSQVKNSDGTRTDTWVMDLPHSPYLFFIGVGEYAVIKDSYKGKEVNYYVEKEYASVARKIFGHTPEMMKFFADKLGIDYPWVKYSQIIGRDYVSGAMENTTATLHQESAQQDARELTDGNSWETTIAHELFHQWFGDLVTAESWSNLTVNESFADYSQLLWLEYKYGSDEAGYENVKEMQEYLTSGEQNKDLVRFYYNDKEDMFDRVSYNKGGRILHMLRNYVGDKAFFASLNKYLIANKFGNGSAHKLRLAFEEVTGQDLNWFFNQWYFGNSHPYLDISYGYDARSQTASVIIQQTQTGEKIFRLPITIDIYNGSKKVRRQVWMENKTDTFQFSVSSKPDLIDVDADKVLLAVKNDHKDLPAFIHQYKYAGSYYNRVEALEFAAQTANSDAAARQLVISGLEDHFYRVRSKALSILDTLKNDDATWARIEAVARTDKNRVTRADAIDVLAKAKDDRYKTLFIQSIKDSSYTVAGAALDALSALNGVTAFAEASKLTSQPSKGRLAVSLANIIIEYGSENNFDYLADNFDKMPLTHAKLEMSVTFGEYLVKIDNESKFRSGIDLIVRMRENIPAEAHSVTDPQINALLENIASKKETAGSKSMAAYVRSKLPKKK